MASDHPDEDLLMSMQATNYLQNIDRWSSSFTELVPKFYWPTFSKTH